MPYSEETIAYAASHGIEPDELPLICDGCSGGVSALYAIAGRHISCEACCDIHDLDYQIGGTGKDRRDADRRLRDCMAEPGGWRAVRAWVMWAAVRLCGGRYRAG